MELALRLRRLALQEASQGASPSPSAVEGLLAAGAGEQAFGSQSSLSSSPDLDSSQALRSRPVQQASTQLPGVPPGSAQAQAVGKDKSHTAPINSRSTTTSGSTASGAGSKNATGAEPSANGNASAVTTRASPRAGPASASGTGPDPGPVTSHATGPVTSLNGLATFERRVVPGHMGNMNQRVSMPSELFLTMGIQQVSRTY